MENDREWLIKQKKNGKMGYRMSRKPEKVANLLKAVFHICILWESNHSVWSSNARL